MSDIGMIASNGALVLPTTPLPATAVNPRSLVFYGRPKVGKTTLLAGLNNCLIVDLEHGTEFVEALKVDGSTIDKIREILKALHSFEHRYKYIALDPISRLDDIVLPVAATMYKNTPQGKNWTGDDILTLPNGGGYHYLRKAFMKVIESFKPVCDHLLLSGHLRSKMLEKGGKEMSVNDIDLTGKLRSMVCSDADAIALVVREGPAVYFDFRAHGNEMAGSRAKHLRGAKIKLSEMQDDETVKTFWDTVFLP
jgi:AAA domain